MKNLIAVAVLALLSFAVPVKSQTNTRVLVGVQTGLTSFDSDFGVTIGIEQPLAKRFEIDASGQYSPVYSHTGLGRGSRYQTEAGGITWLSNTVGVYGDVAISGYTVPGLTKSSDVFKIGPVFRTSFFGLPGRIRTGYLQQFNDGINSNGIETSHEKGGTFSYEVRFPCAGPVCFRAQEGFSILRVLTQSNPICDGTFGITGGPNGGPCYRKPGYGGTFSFSFVVEFPRPRGNWYDNF